MTPEALIAAARARGRGALDEAGGKRLLASFGIAVPRGTVLSSPEQAAAACVKLTPPYALKVISPAILHKSDAGGVCVGLRNVDAVAAAMHDMLARPAIAAAQVDGFLLEEMAPAGQEVVVGGVLDPQFGPLVMTGLGGVFVEVLADVAFRICPVTRLDAAEMLDELRGAALLQGARGRPPASREAIIDVLLKVGGEDGLLLRHEADIREADINPLIVSASGAVAVDARFILT